MHVKRRLETGVYIHFAIVSNFKKNLNHWWFPVMKS